MTSPSSERTVCNITGSWWICSYVLPVINGNLQSFHSIAIRETVKCSLHSSAFFKLCCFRQILATLPRKGLIRAVSKKQSTPLATWGPVVQWLALWTLNPEIRVQVSAGPWLVERVLNVKMHSLVSVRVHYTCIIKIALCWYCMKKHAPFYSGSVARAL